MLLIYLKEFYVRILTLSLLLLLNYTYSVAQNYKTKEVTFLSKGDSLSGTIFEPNIFSSAVVIVHGSGQEKRMTTFAESLAENGIAVFTYDKRGVGQSGGIYAGPEVGTNNVDSVNLNLLALDASAATDFLTKHLTRKKIKIGLLGGSQAGWIIPLAAKLNKKVDFMTIFSGSLVTAKEQLRFQFYTNGNPDFWDTHTEKEAREHIFNDPDKYEFIDTNPLKTLSVLTIPGLWIFGGKDIQVPVNLSIEYIESLKNRNKKYEYKLFPSLGHNTVFSKSNEPLNEIIKWIKAQ